MSSNASSAAARSQSLMARYLKLTDANITRVYKLLSTTSTLETSLLTLTYTLHLVHALLSRLTTLRLRRAADSLTAQLVKSAPDALLPGETLVATISTAPSSRLLRLERSTGALCAVIDDFRMFMRLKGLVGIWVWAASLLRNDRRQDGVLRGVAAAQVTALALYQALENAAYLASKGVVPGWEGKRIAKAFVWSARMWMLHVALEFVKLARQRQLSGQRRQGQEVGDEKKTEVDAKPPAAVAAEQEDEEAKWWRDLYVNLAWAPLTLHYSMQPGFAGEGLVAALGGFAGWMGLLRAWKATA